MSVRQSSFVVLAILSAALLTDSAVLKRSKRFWYPVYYWYPDYSYLYYPYDYPYDWDGWYGTYYCGYYTCDYPAPTPYGEGFAARPTGTVLAADAPAATATAAETEVVASPGVADEAPTESGAGIEPSGPVAGERGTSLISHQHTPLSAPSVEAEADAAEIPPHPLHGAHPGAAAPHPEEK